MKSKQTKFKFILFRYPMQKSDILSERTDTKCFNP